MALYYGISPSTTSYFYIPQTVIVGSSAYGGNFIQGNSSGDIIYGETQDSLYSGSVGGNTIYGGNGSNTIYGDAYGLYGTISAHSNTIYSDAPNAQDFSAVNTVYGNACVMAGDSAGGTDQSGTVVGNTIWDSVGNTSYLYGNAYSMTDHAWGGYNTIHVRSFTGSAYGDAYQISGSATFDMTHGLGVHGGHNIINLDGPSSSGATGAAYGDAYSITGAFDGGHNQIWIHSSENTTVYGTAYTLNGTITCGSNLINDYYSNATIYGDAYQNLAGSDVTGGGNIIHGPGIGTATMYGECQTNAGQFTGGHNTFGGGGGSDTIYGDCASNTGNFAGGHNTIYASYTFNGPFPTSTIYGDCASNTGNFSGGYNTIYAKDGNVTMFGSATDGHNTFVFEPGTGVDQIGARSGNGPVFQGFDQEGGTALDHAHGDVIDVSAYHLGGFQNLVIGANASGDAVVHLPPAAAGAQGGQVTLVGVHPQDLTASDFHF